MSSELSFRKQNGTSTERMRALAAQLTDAQLQQPVGEHWTVAIALAHLAFWDRRVLDIIERSERAGSLIAPTIDVAANDLSLPLWAAVPPRAAAQLAVDAAAALDARLKACPPDLLAGNERWINRGLHRNGHLDEIEAALRQAR
jgi:hypothetical protein